MIKLEIDGQGIVVAPGTTILEAADKIGKKIPTLCHDPRIEAHGSCRICVVEVKGAKSLLTACSTPVENGMEILTHSPKVVKARTGVLNLLVSNHQRECGVCGKEGKCSLRELCGEYRVEEGLYGQYAGNLKIDESNPFFIYNPNKCILCRKCVLICSRLQCTDALTVAHRGFDVQVTVPFEKPIETSPCVSCGNCVSACPVGALVPKSKEKYSYDELKPLPTTCPYCGVGCQLELLVKDNKVVEVQPLSKKPNQGLLCVKGKFGFRFINHPDRIKKPLVKKDGDFIEVSWEEAYKLIVQKINKIRKEAGSVALAGLASARCTNEENYLMQKLFRAVLGTNNIDHCARLCHASSVQGLATTLGSGAMTNSIEEILDNDVIFVTGSNTTENHPVIGAKIKQAVNKGAKLIVADPRRIELAEKAHIFLQIKPGTNVALFNGLLNVIIEEGLYDEEFITGRTENFSQIKEHIEAYTPEVTAKVCGVDPQDIIEAARLYGKGKKAAIYYSMGITQHSNGTDNVLAISNLALACGNLGKEGGGVNPLRGQNNVQGACDMGALPNVFPGYQKVQEPQIRKRFEQLWGTELTDQPGLTLTEMMDGAAKGDIKFLYVMGENPMVSDPNLNHVQKALKSLEFLVVQDIFLTETAQLADVVLPAVTFAEKDGTFTNTERRVQRIRKAIEPLGEAKADWQILMELMARLGYSQSYQGPVDIMEEIAAVTPQYGGINYQRIKGEGLQWPCPNLDHPGTQILHQGSFTIGRGLFKAVRYLPPAEEVDQEYPLILTTGRILYQYHTRTMTGRVEGLNQKAPESYIEINPKTAQKLQISHNEKVRVTSRRGSIITKARVQDIVEPMVVFMPFHYAQGAANILTNNAVDKECKIPELKVCAVKIEKIQ